MSLLYSFVFHFFSMHSGKMGSGQIAENTSDQGMYRLKVRAKRVVLDSAGVVVDGVW